MKSKRLKSREAAPVKPSGGDSGLASETRRLTSRLWSFRFVAWLSPLFLLVLAEAALRIFGYGYPTSFFIKTVENGRTVLVDNPRFGWRFFPPAVARSPRPLSFEAKKLAGTVRIFVLGESAAMGDPEPTYGFARQLERLLQARHPEKRFEVINAAMTAINSHVMRQIVLDCRLGEGDFWLVYAGNNEVVGPFGAGTVFGKQAANLGLVRFILAVKSTRLGQLLVSLGKRSAEPADWGGMEMFLSQQVPRNDPRLKNVYASFAANLGDVVNFGRDSGATVLLATVPVNLKDSPPFGSMHRMGLSPDQKAQWDRQFLQGCQAETNGVPAGPHEQDAHATEALKSFDQAAQIDPDYAEMIFRQARCRLLQGPPASAAMQFQLARDLDTLRFRADSRLNGIIRQIASAKNVAVVDAETECSRQSPEGLPGDELFYDHVHLNFKGNYLVAKLFAEQIEKAWRGVGAGQGSILSEDEVARRLAFTEFDQHRILEEIRMRLQQPPFSVQSNFRARDLMLEKALAQSQPAARELAPSYETALALSPGDWMLRGNYGRLLEATGDIPGATTQWRQVAEAIPHFAEPWSNLGHLAHTGGRYDEAEGFFRETLKRNPNSVEALNELGLIAASQGHPEAARQHFVEALKLKPGYSAARINLALSLANAGNLREAEIRYREVLRRDTNNVDARVHLGSLKADQGHSDEALALFQDALRLKPEQSTAHHQIAKLFAAQGRHEEAIEQFEAALLSRPDLAQAQLDYGLELARLGRESDALARFAEAAKLRPDVADARFNYGIALAKAGRFTEARGEFQQTLRLQPSHPLAARALMQTERSLGTSPGK